MPFPDVKRNSFLINELHEQLCWAGSTMAHTFAGFLFIYKALLLKGLQPPLSNRPLSLRF